MTTDDWESDYWEEDEIECVTKKPVAFDSPDHICPVGALNDNTSNMAYTKDVERYFEGKKINILDCGCAGGGFVVDFAYRGHFSIGIEGSDTGIKHKIHNWPRFGGSLLHTADITKPFKILRNGKRVKFDVISAWEVLEHLEEKDIPKFVKQVMANLKPKGFFVGSVNMTPDERVLEDGTKIILHQTVKPEDYWKEVILKDFIVKPYPFRAIGRSSQRGSFYISIHKK